MEWHGAERVPIQELVERSMVIWRIRPHEEISETCVRLEEFTASAARDARSALRVIDRIRNLGNGDDQDLIAALKKYVEVSVVQMKKADMHQLVMSLGSL